MSALRTSRIIFHRGNQLRAALNINTHSHRFLRVTPIAFNSFSVRFNSSNVTPTTTPETVEGMTEVAKQVFDVVAIGDMKAAGLGNMTPVGLVQNALELLHIGGSLPWWASIMTITVGFRLFMFPLIVKQMKNTAKMSEIRPEMERITGLMNKANAERDQYASHFHANELRELFKKHNASPFKALSMPLIQAPIFISFFMALRQMATLPIESMKTGGLFWFSDLTTSDPYYALPVISASAFLLTIELGTDGIPPDQKEKFKYIFRFMAAASIPLAMNFPAALLLYWTTSSIFSLNQHLFFKIPGVKKFLNIPEIVRHAPKPSEKKAGLLETFKEQYNQELERLNEGRKVQQAEKTKAAKIAAGPLPFSPIKKPKIPPMPKPKFENITEKK